MPFVEGHSTVTPPGPRLVCWGEDETVEEITLIVDRRVEEDAADMVAVETHHCRTLDELISTSATIDYNQCRAKIELRKVSM